MRGRFAFMAKGKKSFLLYCDQAEIFKKLPDDKAAQLIRHIFAYVNDENPECDDLLLQIAFEPIKQQLKRDLDKYEDRCDVNKTNGAKGGRPKKTKENQNNPLGFSETQQNQSEPKKPDNDNDIDNGTDSGIDNVNEKEKRKKGKASFEEVLEYATQRGWKREFAEKFFDTMQATGWKVSKQPCKDWQAAFRTWEKPDWNQQYRINKPATNYSTLTP